MESVVWAAERKDVLASLFALTALLCYVRAARRGNVSRALALPALYLLALLAKPMPVTLPFVLLLVDWWPLGRWSPGGMPTAASARARRPLLALIPPAHLWLEKAPLFLLAAISAAVTLAVQHHGGAMDFGDSIPGARRAANVAQAYCFYLRKTVWPVDLAVFYPFPTGAPAAGLVLGEVVALVGITWAMLRWFRRSPYLALGWLWFLGTLVPAIGLVQVGAQAWADRYTYLPLTGLFIAGSWGLGALATNRPRWTPTITAAACATILVCLGLTRAQVACWRDSFTLYGHAIEATADNWLAHNNFGTILMERGRAGEAAGHFTESLKIRPGLAQTWVNLGDALLAGNEIPQATAHYRTALELAPELSAAHVGLGAALERGGSTTEAQRQFEDALRLNPAGTDAACHLARLRLRAGDTGGAAALLEGLLNRDPAPARAHTLYGEVLATLGQEREAEKHYREAIRLSPDDPDGHLGLGALLAARGDLDQAASSFSRAASIKPALAEAHYNLGKVLDLQGRTAEAARRYRLAIGASPDFAEAHNNLGVDLLLQGAADEGAAHLREALRLKPEYREARMNLEMSRARE